jgi:hypothetical protein
MILEKNRIRQIINEHKISLFESKDENELANILYDAFIELGQLQQEKLATKEDIRMVIQMMDKRFEAVDKRFEAVDKRFEAVDKRFEDLYKYMDKRFEDMNKKFTMMFTFMNIGFALIIMLTVLFKFLS